MLRLSFHDIKRNGIEYNKMGAVYEHFFVLLKYFRCNAEDVTPLPEALPYGYELPRLDSEASRQLVSSTLLPLTTYLLPFELKNKPNYFVLPLTFRTFARNFETTMLRFICFGSGSSGNCYLLQTDTDALLIDVGVGLRGLKKACREYGFNLACVHHVLVTHDHADHIKSVGSFSKDYQCPVYATSEVHKGILRNYCVAQKVPSELVHILEKDTTISVGDFQVTPFAVPHDSSDNVGYFVEASGTNFCLITDAGEVTDQMKGYIQRARHLVIEANHDTEMVLSGPYPPFLKSRILSGTGHLSNLSCAQAVVDNMSDFLEHIWLCHLSEENNHPELARKTVETVLRSHGVIPGVDVQLEVLKRTVPTGPFDLSD